MSSSAPSSDCSPSSSPLAANAPKFGTPVPNRIFVGGIAPNTTEAELLALFTNFGNVKASKIISDRAGVSKGYGFVTFETEEEAKRILKEADNISLKDRKLNIAPAIKKQPSPRVYGEMTNDGSPTTPNGAILCHNGIQYTYHNGMAFFGNTPDSVYQYHQPQATASYPFVYPHTVYVPHQPITYQGHAAAYPTQYLYATPLAASAVSQSTSVSSSPTPSNSPGSSTRGGTGITTVTNNSGASQASSATCTVSNTHIGSNGEFFTLYNSGSVTSIPQSGLSAIPMVPGFSIALANPISSDRSGPLTPTSPDYSFESEIARNSEVMTRSPYSSPGLLSMYSPPRNQLYNQSSSYCAGALYPSPSYSGYSSTTNSNNNTGHNVSDNNNGGGFTANTGYNCYKNNSSGYNGNSYNSSSGRSYSTVSDTQTHNSGYKISGYKGSSGKKSTAVNSSPVKIYNHHRNNPSTPKSSTSSNSRQRDRQNSTESCTSTNDSGYYATKPNDLVSSRTFKHLHGQEPNLVAKSVNGVTVMAYPTPLVVNGSPISQPLMATTMMNVTAKDHQLIQGDNYSNADLIRGIHAEMTAPITPPHTPLTSTICESATKKITEQLLNIKKLSL